MFKKVIINSFRSINNLEIDDLKKVNLFVGKNNCGKTSVLEGIYLLSNPMSILNLVNIRNFRKMYIDSEVFNNALLTIFNNMDTDIPVKIEGFINSYKKKELTINYIDESKIRYDENIGGFPIGGLHLNYITFEGSNITDEKCYEVSIWERGERLKNKIVIKENNSIESVVPFPVGVRISQIASLTKEQKSVYLSPKMDMNDIAGWLNKLQISKEIGEIIEILQEIEPSIKDLRIGADGIIYCDVGVKKLIPINVMGDGILKLLIILSAIYNAKGGFVFIDEIENGLHYSSLEILWKGIFEASKKFNVQIFATTHSWECIEAFSNVHENDAEEGVDIRLYRIERYENELKAIDYDRETIKEAIKMKWEMR
ncbi:AAA family ATPase [Methanotorris igneus]|uniref:ATPase-like protein n=1 Tax=Methanotorris igneus (strain DSM 5666 / JCM 11834 / Kol 5) TaxID=880724 RepID=F6BB14_METIK|nr:AAA family ATPase [Methanotorris igneus]AEF97101.1 ATPase-like protein [Methanotorris igneus Kol 5]